MSTPQRSYWTPRSEERGYDFRHLHAMSPEGMVAQIWPVNPLSLASATGRLATGRTQQTPIPAPGFPSRLKGRARAVARAGIAPAASRPYLACCYRTPLP